MSTAMPDRCPAFFSGLSMINEDAAFFMSVDTPFMEPETGIALLDAIGDADICMVRRKSRLLRSCYRRLFKKLYSNDREKPHSPSVYL